MNARRRPRLFLDHKPPLVAFTVVAIACALMMVHMARSEATPGWLRAGLGGVVGQQVIAAGVLEHDPAPDSATVAAGPLPVGVPPGSSAPLADGPAGAGPGAPASSAPADGGHATHTAGALVGEVVRGGQDASDPEGDTPDSDDHSEADGSEGHGHGEGRADHPVPDVTLPGSPPAPQARDHHEWRADWVGDRGRGHHGDKGDRGDRGHGHGSHGHGHGSHGHENHGHESHGHENHGHESHGHENHGHGGHGHRVR